MAIVNKPKSKGSFLRSLRKNAPDEMNLDEILAVPEGGVFAPLPLDDLPVKDATGALDVSASQIVEVIPGAAPHEQSTLVPIEDVYIPAPDERGHVQHPRQHVDRSSDEELEASIREHGILIPLIVRPTEFHNIRRLAVIKGSRRLEAARRLGITHIPVIIRKVSRRAAFRMTYTMTAHNQGFSDKEKGLALMQMHRDMGEELQEFLEAHRLVDRGGRPLILSEADWQERRAKIKHVPLWIERTISRAALTSRRAKVSGEDLAQLAGYTPRQLRRFANIAELPDKMVEQLSGRQAMALAVLQSPEQRAALAREIKRDGLTGEQAQERARQMSGKTSTRSVRVNEPPRFPEASTPENDPLFHLQNASREASEAAKLLESGVASEEFRARVLREIEVLEMQLRRLKAASK